MKIKILVAGGSGFIGTNLLKKLSKNKKYQLYATFFKSKKFYKIRNVKYFNANLENLSHAKKVVKNKDIVIMCAANSSGAQVIKENPLSHFSPNLRMNINILQAAHELKVKKFIFISSNTVYPVSSKPMKENDINYKFFKAYHIVGWMKLFSEICCEIYSKKIQKPLDTMVIRPGNLYGPFDKFDKVKSKVIPSLIRKSFEKNKYLEVWGDGNDIKDFIYIEDFCKIIDKILLNKKWTNVLNIASGNSIALKKIIQIICKIRNINQSSVKFLKNKAKMIPERKININKLKKIIKIKNQTPIYTGINKTIEWYEKNLL